MKIKTKLRIGFGFLFIVVLFFGAIALYFIQEISKNANVILKDNYETLSYTREMRTLLDENDLPLSNTVIAAFDRQLNKEANNITEKGEQQAVIELRRAFKMLKATAIVMDIQQRAEREVRQHLRQIESLNMQAIVRKNDAARSSVNRALRIRPGYRAPLPAP